MATTERGSTISKSSPQVSLLRRVGVTVSWMVSVIASLLVFPSAIPWMMAFWVAGYSIAAYRHRGGWLYPIGCLAILIVKRPYWPVSFVVMASLLAAAGAMELVSRLRKRPISMPSRGAILLSLWLACVACVVQWHTIACASRPIKLRSNGSVVCMGDSLTSGVRPFGGYPDDLQSLLSVHVINLGQPGITSHDGLKSLEQLKAADPQVVVIELGGHDYLRGRPRSETMADLQALIDASRSAGARVVLMEVPRGFLTDPYQGMERELAERNDLQLVTDSAVRNLVLWSPFAPPGMWIGEPYLSDDGLHPNDHGNRYLAKRVAAVLVQ